MHHPAAQHFQPFTVFTHDVHFCRRFGKREVGRTEANLQIFLKEVTQEVVQRAFQVGKADVGINNQTFHLMEHRRVSLVVVVTINTARRDDTNRWLLGFHGADLYARGLGTQQAGSVKPESVVVSARRVVTRNVQSIEVMIIVFDFRPGCHGKAKLTEETFDTVDGTGNRMQTAVFNATTWQRDINRFRRQTRIQCSAFQFRFTRIQRLLNLLFRFVDNRTSCRTLFWRQLTQGRHLKG